MRKTERRRMDQAYDEKKREYERMGKAANGVETEVGRKCKVDRKERKVTMENSDWLHQWWNQWNYEKH